jgi:hypothetical protein
LGKRLTLESRVRDWREGLRVQFDWEAAENSGSDLTRISHRLERFEKELDDHGTLLLIENLRDAWSEDEFERLQRMILLLQTPPSEAKRTTAANKAPAGDIGFAVTLNGASAVQNIERQAVEESLIKLAVGEISGELKQDGTPSYDLKSSKLSISEHHEPNVKYVAPRPLRFAAHYFIYESDLLPRGALGRARQLANRYGGIRVYRDGFRVMPYGEPYSDWLDLAFDQARRFVAGSQRPPVQCRIRKPAPPRETHPTGEGVPKIFRENRTRQSSALV